MNKKDWIDNIDDKFLFKYMKKIIGIIIILFLPLTFLKQDFGLKRKITSKNYKICGFLFYFLLFYSSSLVCLLKRNRMIHLVLN